MIKYLILIIIFVLFYALSGIFIDEKSLLLMGGFWLGFLYSKLLEILNKGE